MSEGGRGRVGAWVMVVVGGVMVVLALLGALLHLVPIEGDRDAVVITHEMIPPVPGAAIRASEPELDASPMPEGALGQIITDPDPNRIPLCDDRNWPDIDAIVASVGPTQGVADIAGTAWVHGEAWAGLAAGARTGIASWASKCALNGGRVRVLEAQSGAELGVYDGSSGLRSSSSPVP